MSLLQEKFEEVYHEHLPDDDAVIALHVEHNKTSKPQIVVSTQLRVLFMMKYNGVITPPIAFAWLLTFDEAVITSIKTFTKKTSSKQLLFAAAENTGWW